MNTPHKHAGAIHAWADGAVIEDYSGKYWKVNPSPSWSLDFDFRIKPHKWQREIDAMKAGKPLQTRFEDVSTWVPVRTQGLYQFDEPGLEFRIKPEVLRYRVARARNEAGSFVAVVSNTLGEAAHAECCVDFVEWLGDWQEVEVPA